MTRPAPFLANRAVERLLAYMHSVELQYGSAPCAEFPNDNPRLHRGAIWRCAQPNESPSCELQRSATAIPPRHSTILPPPVIAALALERTGVIESLESLESLPPLPPLASLASLESLATLASLESLAAAESFEALGPSSVPRDPFATLMAALEETAVALGADETAVGCLRALFGIARWDGGRASSQALDALLAGHVLVGTPDGRCATAPSSAFTDQVAAWQGILRGESEDFSSCAALDEWAADVLARVLGNPARADAIRRELRRRGVAAFGIVADAA